MKSLVRELSILCFVVTILTFVVTGCDKPNALTASVAATTSIQK